MDRLLGAPPSRSQRLLRSILGGGAVYFALFALVHVVLAFTSAGTNAWDLVSLVLVLVPQWVLIRRRTLDLPLRPSIMLALIVGAAALTGLLSIADVARPDGYDAWFLGAVAFDLLGLAVAGRFGSAWVGMGVVAALCIGWALLGGRPVGIGIGLVVRHVATLAVGTALAVSLRRSSATAVIARGVQRRRRMEEDVARARASARRSQVEQVLEQAGPVLRSIAEGRPTTPEERRQMLVIEGALRDQIRTPRLNASELRSVVDTARRRGVNVLLLDEADAAGDDARLHAVHWLAERLAATPEGRFVGRLRDTENGGVRVSAVRDEQGEAEVFGTREPVGG
ncbi:hypothetical protein [Amnibacterium setariae]|uniref:Uncharacterized protein n=1 Tax=Amnibacterium setariae TaxID=2306585 RepID=A0A3A1TX60_9MICO|nr:hypothetical protein [Amnibacterium setariae]RIX28782.1 hypothetical protein D1781_15450 [Amnibacterium setariae]